MSDRQGAAGSAGERLWNGLVRENPTFVLMLGMCPTLAVTTSAINGLGMGLTTTVVLMLSNLIISLLRKIIPNRVRIPAFIVIIASFVTMVQLLLEAYLPSLNKALGVYIPLIVVNCIILGRAESYAYSNPPVPSFFDGLGMGLGFSFALTCIGAFREFLSAGSLFGLRVMPASFTPISIFGLAPGAFFVLAALTALQNFLKREKKAEAKEELPAGCTKDCDSCGVSGCGSHGKFYDDSPKKAEKQPEKPEERAAEQTEQPEQQATEKQPEQAAEQTEKLEGKGQTRKHNKKRTGKPDKKQDGEMDEEKSEEPEKKVVDDLEIIDLEEDE